MLRSDYGADPTAAQWAFLPPKQTPDSSDSAPCHADCPFALGEAAAVSNRPVRRAGQSGRWRPHDFYFAAVAGAATDANSVYVASRSQQKR
jgi:hypothetical protein